MSEFKINNLAALLVPCKTLKDDSFYCCVSTATAQRLAAKESPPSSLSHCSNSNVFVSVLLSFDDMFCRHVTKYERFSPDNTHKNKAKETKHDRQRRANFQLNFTNEKTQNHTSPILTAQLPKKKGKKEWKKHVPLQKYLHSLKWSWLSQRKVIHYLMKHLKVIIFQRDWAEIWKFNFLGWTTFATQIWIFYYFSASHSADRYLSLSWADNPLPWFERKLSSTVRSFRGGTCYFPPPFFPFLLFWQGVRVWDAWTLSLKVGARFCVVSLYLVRAFVRAVRQVTMCQVAQLSPLTRVSLVLPEQRAQVSDMWQRLKRD